MAPSAERVGIFSMGDDIIACVEFLNQEGDLVASAGDPGTITAMMKGSNLVQASFEGKTVYVDTKYQITKIGHDITNGLKVGDTAMCIRDATDPETGGRIFSIGDTCKLLTGLQDGLVLSQFPCGKTAELQPAELSVPGMCVAENIHVGQSVVSCINYKDGSTAVKAGDVGMVLSSVDGELGKISVKFPNCCPMNVAPSWQIRPEGLVLPGGYLPGDEIVCCVSAGKLTALSLGTVLGAPANNAENMVRVEFPECPSACVDARWHIARRGQLLQPGLRIAGVVRSKATRGKKIGQGDMGVITGPNQPDKPGTIRVLFRGSHFANMNPDDLELVEPLEFGASPDSALKFIADADAGEKKSAITDFAGSKNSQSEPKTCCIADADAGEKKSAITDFAGSKNSQSEPKTLRTDVETTEELHPIEVPVLDEVDFVKAQELDDAKVASAADKPRFGSLGKKNAPETRTASRCCCWT